ncbi:MAG: hypothetical protein A3J30_04050 [Candidatus Wildermuthbacteria bacterium RIFCSPLOWO2_02_FULL_47_9c]|uniref:Uncharacterized protein n=2 Tax=Parcubacteria group TaxID=1794811 RepID=A0A837IMQ1_9BACT|nr:MAG: hypothetical protein UY25_C0003G0073 [Candidatus Yanofskybacteria bacterium GW2011_GWC1_48_11]KKW13122.1 MAG: hypothetical protein UY53_C0018G0006 [Parcubacteria group bacterium GW2011_GWA2_50_10]OHA74581.1 MAG: hypothetical protein A3B28_03655 [Candidatus Wildermuthbacteria bacterium RIFCSPLOWO2_01_FULL_50_46]OHA76740.1 MAG: hypothetical protein A3J30_04050 [Candidatus Wildermuthbacteria bacterium RIFCSPLOWO2_02_FULL_47_9c]OHA77814.1 MAG: hypothetical protein A2564_01280 [Candidatus Wi
MTTITLPKKLTRASEDLVAIPRKEYEEFLRLRLERIPEIGLTLTQKKRLAEGLGDIKAGRVIGPFKNAKEAVRTLRENN